MTDKSARNECCGAYTFTGQHLASCSGSVNVEREANKLISEIEAATQRLKAGAPSGGGLRFDAGKNRVDLLPPDALMELGKVYAYGATKYASRNWERGMPWSKVIGPLLRHLFKWMMGQKIDEESGQLHSAMIAWNAIALLTYELRGIGHDDRLLLQCQHCGAMEAEEHSPNCRTLLESMAQAKLKP